MFGYRDVAIGGKAIKTIQEKYGDKGVVEMNRLAVSPKARKNKIAADLVVSVFQYLAIENEDERPLIATAAHNSWVPGFIDHIPGVGENKELIGDPFLYEITDPEPVQLYLFCRESIKKSSGKYLVHHNGRKDQNKFCRLPDNLIIPCDRN